MKHAEMVKHEFIASLRSACIVVLFRLQAALCDAILYESGRNLNRNQTFTSVRTLLDVAYPYQHLNVT